MDSLSCSFLVYAGYTLPSVLLRDPTSLAEPARRPGRRMALGTALVVLLDVVIDPLAVRGDRWFLGKKKTIMAAAVYWPMARTRTMPRAIRV
jgi:putative membrane protein